MEAICKFCGKPIKSDYYFITKAGTICPDCKGEIKKEVNSFTKILNPHPQIKERKSI